MFDKTTLAALVGALSLTLAAPASVRRQTSESPSTFVAITTHSGTPAVHLRAVNANGGNFFIGRDSSAYCPPNIDGLDCSGFSNSTIFAAIPNTDGTLSLDDSVPGGQQIYVNADGSLAYTPPHSSGGEKAYTGPFKYTPQPAPGRVGGLTFDGDGFYACPVEADEGVYQLYAAAVKVDSLDGSACIGVNIATSEWDGPSAWQY